jgi:hypothetical protein
MSQIGSPTGGPTGTLGWLDDVGYKFNIESEKKTTNLPADVSKLIAKARQNFLQTAVLSFGRP